MTMKMGAKRFPIVSNTSGVEQVDANTPLESLLPILVLGSPEARFVC